MALANKETTEVARRQASGKVSKERLPLVSLILGGLAFVSIMIAIPMAFLYAPTDEVQGPAQRIFYFHVPIAWIGMLAFVVMAIASIGYLWKRDERWDWTARAAAEIGTVFITLTLITGSIWGRTTWGTWWSWDPKLTASLILWFMYIGYLMVRSYMGRTPASANAGAVLAIIGVFDVPIIYEAVNLWRGLHPSAQVGVAGALPPEVIITLMVSLAGFTLLYAFLMLQLYQFQKLQTLAQRLRATVEYDT
ncbi:MAG: cytochrome c biogenesis protein CcsA [Ktedonobacteraceae bacterium]